MQSERIAHFRILEPLGRGGMGVVYLARDEFLGREVALKLIRPERAGHAVSRARFLRECRAEAAVAHPGIATLYEAGETAEGGLYFAAERVRGETLRTRVHAGPLDLADVFDLGAQLAEALGAAHASGIVHRDVKPENVMVTPEGRVKVLDFGLARLSAGLEGPAVEDAPTDTVHSTAAGVVLGTPAYMAPEQVAGGAVDARTDVFACGIVLYEMATGVSPFSATSSDSSARRVLTEDPLPPDVDDPSLPPALAAVLRRALAKDPARRFDSGAELAAALRDAARGQAPPRIGGSRRRAWLLGVGVALAAAAAAAVGSWWGSRPPATLGEPGRLLIADVDNRTGDEAFDVALRTALEAALRQSRHVAVFDRGQVAETLRLMRRDPSTAIDEDVGRDVCRFAGVQALLLPRIVAAGDVYDLSAVLVAAESGAHIAEVRVVAEGRKDVLLHGIDDLARRVRRGLGESVQSIAKADIPVTAMTTSSWEALRLLGQGQEAWDHGQYRDAGGFLELALEKDPRFASARGTLGLLQIQFLGEIEKGRENLRRALADSGSLPERERLMIRAVNLQFVDQDSDAALEQYRIVCEMYPDLMQPWNNRGRILMALGRNEEAERMFEQAWKLSPRSAVPLSNLYYLHVNRMRRPDLAERDARRLIALSDGIANYHAMLGWSLVAQQRYREALAPLERAVDIDPSHPYAVPNLAHVLLRLGRAADAVPIYTRLVEQSAGPQGVMQFDLAVALRAAGRDADARRAAEDGLEALGTSATDVTGRMLRARLEALAGRADAARSEVAAVAPKASEPNDLVAVAQTLATLGEREAALDALRRGVVAGYGDPYFPLVMPSFHPIAGDPGLAAALRPADAP